MRCEEARPLISAGLDGELDTSSEARVRAHMAECVLCSSEREAVAETVQWLRALPEAEPPAELRRRIGMALLEAESAAGRKWFGFALPVRPRTPGWAWGAALGTAAASLILLSAHRPMPARRMVAAPLSTPALAPPVTRASAPSSGADSSTSPALGVQPAVKLKQTKPAPLATTPTAILPSSAGAPSTVPLPRPQVLASSAPSPHAAARKRVPAQLMPGPHQSRPLSAHPMRAAPGPMPGGSASPAHPESTADGSSLLVRGDSPPPDAATPEPSDDQTQADTAGMTQMASGDASGATAVSTSDDLDELRQRLTERRPPVPQLGALKPTVTPRPGQNGWIRF
jgi:hypothetical protein